MAFTGTVKVASLQKSGDQNIIRPSWLLDCLKQNEKDAGLPDFLLPFEPKYVPATVMKH
jgi:DNA ligase-4